MRCVVVVAQSVLNTCSICDTGTAGLQNSLRLIPSTLTEEIFYNDLETSPGGKKNQDLKKKQNTNMYLAHGIL